VTLPAGARLGPYAVVAPLGAGGMGEVYRAHDARLGRDVAVKVISSEGPTAPDRMEMFHQEARALAALDHPHILALHDFGSADGLLYAVFELLEGQTLRQRLQAGALTVRKALDLAVQICRGLHAAHARGIVHRDLKPENVFLAADGHVKVLDFGLAQLRVSVEAAAVRPMSGDTATPTSSLPSGTFGYMSPEQLRGAEVGPTSDLFALGVVLYEMVSGRRPFEASTTPQSVAAVLTRDPPEMASPSGPLPPALESIVRRCLEKDPKDRFQSAHDLAFALEAVLGGATTSARPLPRARVLPSWLPAAAVAVIALVGGVFLGRALRPEPSTPVFTQLTFRRGWANFARFAPDGRTVVYTAAWDGGPPEVFTTRTDSRVSQALGLKHAAVLAVSSRGELAVLLDPNRQAGLFTRGVLATVPLGGGDPREVLGDVQEADWAPDGKTLAVLRAPLGGEQTLEMPPGEVRYRSAQGLRLMRVSPDGGRIAFIEGAESARRLMAYDLASGRASILADGLPSNLFGLAWPAGGREIWLTVGESAASRDVVAVKSSGGGADRRDLRIVYRSLTAASLLDVAPDGRALLLRGTDRWGAMSRLSGSAAEQDLSIFDFTVPAAVTPDGRTLLLDEFSQASGPAGAVYVRRLGGPLVRLTDGTGCDLSPDGASILVKAEGPPRLLDVSNGPTLARTLDLGAIAPRWAKWVPPDSQRVVVLGNEPSRPLRLWLADRSGKEKPRALGPEAGATFFAVSRDGVWVASRFTPGVVTLLPTGGGPSREIAGVPDDLVVGSFNGDGRWLYLVRTSVSFPCEVHRLELATGRVEPWKRVAPADATGISQCAWMNLSADGHSYAYGYFRSFADLVLAEGLR